MLYYCSLLIYLFSSIPFLCFYFWPLQSHNNYYYYYHYYYYVIEFITPAFVGDLSLESEWRILSSSLQNSSDYYKWSLCRRMDSLNSSSNVKFFLFIFPSFLGTVLSTQITICITIVFMFHCFFVFFAEWILRKGCCGSLPMYIWTLAAINSSNYCS